MSLTSGGQRRHGSRSRSCAVACSRTRLDPHAPISPPWPAVFPSSTAEHRREFPSHAAEVDYERRIRECYPLHPELFDRLYDDWATLERFQRTRGVLRLMSTVINALWQVNDAYPLIMPGDSSPR